MLYGLELAKHSPNMQSPFPHPDAYIDFLFLPDTEIFQHDRIDAHARWVLINLGYPALRPPDHRHFQAWHAYEGITDSAA